MKKLLSFIIVAALAVALLCSGVYLSELRQRREEERSIDSARADKPSVPPTTAPDPSVPVSSAPESPDETDSPLMDFTSLKARNPDIIAWITVDGTDMDYAVTQTDNNDFYLTHDMYKEKNRNGSIFLDCANSADFSDPNSIIYGHNMRSGAMFAGLNRFKDRNYFDNHTTGRLFTPEQSFILDIFAVAVVPSVGNAYTKAYASETEWNTYLTQLKDDALFVREQALPWGTRLVTLSTCSYEFDNSRTILIARVVGSSIT